MENSHEQTSNKKKKGISLRLLRTVIIGLTVLILGVGIGYSIGKQATPVNSVAGSFMQSDPLAQQGLDFSLFWQVWSMLEQTYLEPDDMDPQQMVYGAIEGMTAALGDPYTVFLPPKDNQRTKEDLSGAFEGVGIQLGYKRDTVAVMSPLEGMPAIKQGVKAGDLILNIKDEAQEIDEDTIDMTLQEAVELIRGPKGTPVTLSLFREEKGSFEVTIVRDTILVPSVEWELGNWTESGWEESVEGSIMWVKLRRFGERTQSEWDDMVQEVLANQAQVEGVVIDVRNNPGGYLQGAIDLSSDFITDGVIVKQQGRFDTKTYQVSRRGRLIGMPVAVLINGGSASASEIMAGALRDRLGVQLVGEQSFGKGTVQEAPDLQGGAGLHVTIARWLLPGGSSIHEDGLTPDVEVELPDFEIPEDATNSAEIDFQDTQLQKAIEVLQGN